ncbi:MAG: DnaJ domain-containing protein [Clostridia bacterium]|nr:DnaJ domain-containing protein [Clostridia bacterium]
MKKSNLELLGVSEDATEDEIKEAYSKLCAKYLEDRFKDGEEGNEAARMLTKLDTAYNEIIAELAEQQNGEGTSFERVEELIKSGDIQEAQRVLDSFNERSAKWHYLQSVVFYKKNWMNESKKQLEIAIQLEPDNEKYKQTYRKLSDRISNEAKHNNTNQQGAYQGQTVQSTGDEDQMGGSFCNSCIQCCAINMCINMLCNCCR